MESRFYKLVPYHISRIKKSRPAYPFKSSGALKQFDELVKASLSPKGYGVPYTQKAFTYTDVKRSQQKMKQVK